jgi:hypothetical protein
MGLHSALLREDHDRPQGEEHEGEEDDPHSEAIYLG